MIIPVHGAHTPISDDARLLAGHGPEYYLDSANIRFSQEETVSGALTGLSDRLSSQENIASGSLAERILLIEKTLFNDIETNPFTISFEALDGVSVSGVWNQPLTRIEC